MQHAVTLLKLLIFPQKHNTEIFSLWKFLARYDELFLHFSMFWHPWKNLSYSGVNFLENLEK